MWSNPKKRLFGKQKSSHPTIIANFTNFDEG